MATREQVSIDVDAEVAAILRAHAAEAHVSEGEIVDRAIRAYDLRSLIARIRERNDLDEDQAMALVREELRAARAQRRKALDARRRGRERARVRGNGEITASTIRGDTRRST